MSLKSDFWKLYEHPLWQKKRLQVLEYAKWRCQLCGSKDKQLHAHHSYYTKGKKPWQYPTGSLIALCNKCHERFHGKQNYEEPATDASPIPDSSPLPPEKCAASFEAILEMLKKI